MPDSREDFIIAIRYALIKKGAKQKFSLFFLISLSILVITLDKISLPIALTTRSVLNDVVYKVAYFAATPEKFFNYLNLESKNHFDTVRKNKILEEKINELKNDRYDNLFLKTENKNLKRTLNLKNITSNGKNYTISAKVIIDQRSPFLRSLLINKGKNHGIIKGMTVFSQKHLIGRIVESNFLSARVLLVTDLNSMIPVVIQDTKANAILVGAGKKTNLSLLYLPDEFLLEPNKIIFTSGKDGLLSAGLPVAITYLNKNNKLQIKSLADPRQALIVNVTSGQMNK